MYEKVLLNIQKKKIKIKEEKFIYLISKAMDIKEIINQLVYCIQRKDYKKLEFHKHDVFKAKIQLDELDITKIEFEKFRTFVNESTKYIDENTDTFNSFKAAETIIELYINAEMQDQREKHDLN